LNNFNKPIFMVAGNWDQSYGKSRIKNTKDYYHYLKDVYNRFLGDKINPQLARSINNLKNCMFKCVEFKGINFVGYGLSSAPEKPKRSLTKKIGKVKAKKLEESYKRISNKLVYAYKNRKNKNLSTIFITHNIPYGTKLDIGKDKNSYVYKKHLGSTIARDFCKRFQPFICIGGHVHEGKGKDKIGKTLILNPGYGKDAQILIEITKRSKKAKFL
jgi:Icc-related predicted phosphoesterase